MSASERKVARPEGPAPTGEKKERQDAPFAPSEPSAGGDSEVGGRDARYVGGQWIYPSTWHTGVYVWHYDGDVYRGPHWHPNRYSPIAYDLDDE